MVCFVTAGGTGGHIFPGISLYKELNNNGHSVFFIGGEKDKKFDAVNKLGSKHIKIKAGPLYRKKLHKNFHTLYLFIKSVFRVFKLMKVLKPEVCVGMGGYVTGPVLLACRIKKIPYIICEQNAYPGFVNKHFASKAEKIILNFKDAAAYLPAKAADKIVELGNPVKPEFNKADRAVARKYFGVKNSDFIIGIAGGSQGAAGINEAVIKLLPMLKNVTIIWSTGNKSYENIKNRIHKSNVKLYSFIDRMDYFLSASDLVISRSGATSLSEIAAIGIPSILVPYPFATADHQFKNASSLSKLGAAVVIKEGEGFDEQIKEVLYDLIGNKSKLNKMGIKAKKLYKPDILSRMVKTIEDVAYNRSSK